ncbi:helix-turn-helix domain-containing protein [Hamadaea tsunoensis]|uniref:helix-turn-helix domain-containing protein n=1 Tax=Hamadaea tsunoensis TaxID=53368 RepID=UPI0004888A5B|nr:helix-turn-helix transcriptional regulator [Hamadaea tsunoensis]
MGAVGDHSGTPTADAMADRRGHPRTGFGWYLRALMERQGYLSDGELETDSGVSASLIARYRSGEVTPTAQNLRRLAPWLGVRLGDLLVESGLATPEELGMVTVDEAGPDVDPAISDAQRHLADPRLPDSAKDSLRTTLQGAMVYWHQQLDRTQPRRRPSPRPAGIART